jgi:arylsulfatase
MASKFRAGLAVNRYRSVRTLGLLVVCALQLSCSGASTAPKAPGRVIWIAIDSLRADHVGAYGYERPATPWMDELARESVRFEWALTPANHTLRSVAGYFSGVPYSMIRQRAAEQGIPAETVTLAEALHDAGVRTLAYTSNAVLGNVEGFDQGFDEFRYIASPGKLVASIDEIIEDIESGYRRSGGREFIYVHTMDAHFPYRPPAPYGQMLATEPYAGKAVIEGKPVLDAQRTPATSSLPYWDPKGWVDAEAIRYLTELYDGCIRYTDARLAALLGAFDWDPETDVVILTADHGEQLYEKGWWSHFETLTPMEIRVPLIVNYAGFAARTIESSVSLLDLYPTLLELFGVPQPGQTTGRSLVSALRSGAELEPGLIYSENAPKAGLSVAVMTDELWYWMRLNRTQHEPWQVWPYEEYLFRFREDPLCANNLVAAAPEDADRLNGLLREFNPRWVAFTRDRIREPVDGVDLGENLLSEALALIGGNGRIFIGNDEGWKADSPVPGVQAVATGIEPGERYLLLIPYTLTSGRIRVALSPAEFKRPGLGQVDYVWRHEIVTSGDASSLLSVVVVPVAETVEFRIVFDPGTRATVGDPELRRVVADWIEPWPEPADKWQDRDDTDELERLKALGYV